MKNIFFIVGEDSGDVLAAGLIDALKARGDVTCLGVGGPLMEEAGFEKLLDMEEITAFGILEVLPKIPNLLKIKDALIGEIEKRQPDAVITVDFPEFNFILAKGLRKRGIYKGKIIHYVAPSVWAWREGRAKKIAKIVDGIMCLFPMEVPYFTKHGIKAAHVGHPIVENFKPPEPGRTYRELNNIPDDTIILGLFFGSRDSEFKNLRKILITATKFVTERHKNIHIIVPTLPKNEFVVQTFIDNIDVPVFISADPKFKWTAFQACDVAVAVSGTVGLELAYANVPHVITYRLNPLTYFILKLLVKVKKAHLVNILMQADIVPEFIQKDCEAEQVAIGLLQLINKPEKRAEMRAHFADFRKFLGEGSTRKPSERAASFVFSMLGEKQHIKTAFNDAARLK